MIRILFLLLTFAINAPASSTACTDHFQIDPKTIVKKLSDAIRDLNKEELKKVLPCHGQIGPWESEFDPFLRERFTDYVMEKRRSQNGKALPFRIVRQNGNSNTYLVAIEKFEFAKDITVPNDMAVFILSKNRMGWKVGAMIETGKASLDDVFMANLDPKAYDKKYRK